MHGILETTQFIESRMEYFLPNAHKVIFNSQNNHKKHERYFAGRRVDGEIN